MPREDYERLMEFFRQHAKELKPFELLHYSVNRKYIYPIARISDSRYVAEYPEAPDYGLGVYIDIYPLDGCGNTAEEADALSDSVYRIYRRLYWMGIDHFVPSPRGRLRSAAKRFEYAITRMIGPGFFMEMVNRKRMKRKYSENKYVGCTVWDVCPLEKAWMTPIELEFEGQSFLAPEGYDAALKSIYGDYMALPPEEERQGHHGYKAYRKEN